MTHDPNGSNRDTCSVCGKPLSEPRAALGLTVCSGKCSRERFQPKDREMTIEITEALIREGDTILVRLQREWNGDDRWRVEPDRARPAHAHFRHAKVVDGWVEATQVAGAMAKDVLRHAEAMRDAYETLSELWPQWEVSDVS